MITTNKGQKKMAFDLETQEIVFNKSAGNCYHCHKQLAWINYGRRNGRGGWEIDHLRPRSLGGTNHLNNLVASCWMCNLDKSDISSRQFKRYTEPLRQERKRKKVDKAVNDAFHTIAVTILVAGGLKLLSNLVSSKNKVLD